MLPKQLKWGRLWFRKAGNGNMMPVEASLIVADGDVQGIGMSVRLARKEAGLKQSDLADLAGVSERTVRAIETGTGNPTLAAVVSVANVLGLHVAAA